MKQTKGFQIWQIIYPVGLCYVVSSLCYFALEILLGSADETYMPLSHTHLDVYKRQAMGRAIVRNPKVFLMDEPLSNLDAKLRVQMRSEIASLHNRLKATIILSLIHI